ncbi:MAG: hypothetical protein IJ082_03410 [Prevotella sp.]|nr:hypothetical protein [Prevotella sp.]
MSEETQILKEVKLKYILTFGNNISNPTKTLPGLRLIEGVSFSLQDNNNATYNLVFNGIKINKKIYQPCEIDADFDFTMTTVDKDGTPLTTVPTFEEVSNLLLQRQVKVEVIEVPAGADIEETLTSHEAFTIANNCYVFEVNPQLMRDSRGTKMFVKANIFSMDKLMTLNKYSKAYVARKLGSGILKPESLAFCQKDSNGNPLIKTNIKGMRFLKYDDQIIVEGDDGKKIVTNIPSEFIQPYLVQYNESFYDFLVRTANRCGEFLFFENGELTLGLPDSGSTMVIDNFLSVTQRNTSPAPLDIKTYVRDSIKDGNGKLEDLNQTVIGKLSTGYPADAFPANTSSNAELANDEYIFPLYKDKFTKLNREAYYDRIPFKALNAIKTFTLGNDFVGSIVGLGVAEGILYMTSKSQVTNTNLKNETKHLKPYDKKQEQSDKNKVVQFSSLHEEGWTTIDYYNDIHKHEAEQQNGIICIDMDTNFANVKLGQKISIKGMNGTYVVIRVQLTNVPSSEGGISQSMQIEAIPAYTDNNTKKFIPPVEPVPVIRKSGPQTAFIADNEDPKFQGRVRVAYPWQSLKGALKVELSVAESSLKEAKEEKKRLEEKKNQLPLRIVRLQGEIDELIRFCKASSVERERMLSQRSGKRAELQSDIEDLEKERAEFEKKHAELEKNIAAKEAELEALKRNPDASKSEIEKTKKEIDSYMSEAIEDDIKKIDARIAQKKQEIEKLEQEEAELKAAASEHDRKTQDSGDLAHNTSATKSEKSYRDPETDNSVIVRKKQEYEQAVKDNETIEEQLEKADDKVNDCESKAEDIKEHIDKDVLDMAFPWVRVVAPMATPGGGTFFRPQKGDEVLINYDNDNVERPYVVGSLFSKNTLEPAEGIERKAAPGMQFGVSRQVSMSIMSPNGHHITFSDPDKGDKFLYGLNPGTQFWGPIIGSSFSMLPNDKDLAGGIHIGDRYGVYEIEMSTHDRYVNVKSPLGTVNINAFTGITIDAPNGDITIRGKNVNIEAGNNLTLTSGTNIKPAGLGDPDYKCGSPLWKSTKNYFLKIPYLIFSALHTISAGALWLGHQAAAAGPGAANDAVGAAPFADLSLFRHMFEIAVKPVEGTTLIKSKRYLKLEAGPGAAKIKADNFPAMDKIDSLENFYIELINVLSDMTDRINKFFTEYQQMWTKAVNASTHYHEVAEAFLKDSKDPDIRQKAFEFNADEWDEVNFNGGGYSEKMKDEDVEFWGGTYRGDEKDTFFCAEIEDYARKIYTLHQHVLGFKELLGDYPDDNAFRKAAKDAFKDYATDLFNKWTQKYGDNEPKEDFAEWVEDLFTRKDGHRLLRRKVAALYLVNVEKSDLNREGKFLTLGYGKSNITDFNTMTTYNWKNMMTHFDHRLTVGNRFAIYLMDGVWEPIKKKWKKPWGAWGENKIWEKQSGQILFSDNDGATLHFNGANVESETHSNLGNREQLLKVLLSL